MQPEQLPLPCLVAVWQSRRRLARLRTLPLCGKGPAAARSLFPLYSAAPYLRCGRRVFSSHLPRWIEERKKDGPLQVYLRDLCKEEHFHLPRVSRKTEPSF